MTIHGGLERHIKYGSLINLTCEIRDYPGPLNFVIWYRDRESLMRNPRYNIRWVGVPFNSLPCDQETVSLVKPPRRVPVKALKSQLPQGSVTLYEEVAKDFLTLLLHSDKLLSHTLKLWGNFGTKFEFSNATEMVSFLNEDSWKIDMLKALQKTRRKERTLIIPWDSYFCTKGQPFLSKKW